MNSCEENERNEKNDTLVKKMKEDTLVKKMKEDTLVKKMKEMKKMILL